MSGIKQTGARLLIKLAAAARVKTPEELREEETRKARNRALALVGGSAAAFGAGRFILSGTDESRLTRMSGGGKMLKNMMGHNPSAGQEQQYLQAYGEAGHEALKATALGVPARKFMEVLRTSPFVQDKDQWRGDPSAWHYDSFQRGPLYGYMQILNEQTQDAKMFGGNDWASKKRRNSFNLDLAKRVNRVSREVAGRDAVLNLDKVDLSKDPKALHRILGQQVNPLDVAAQRRILNEISDTRKLTGYLSPVFASRYRDAVHQTQRTADAGFKNYGDVIGGKLIKARHAAQGAGLLLGGAGLGFGAYYLTRKWQERKRREAEEAARAKKNLATTAPAV